MLAETGSAIGACEAVGMGRKSAYRLHALPGAESFAAAWDAALGMPVRMVTRPARHISCATLGPGAVDPVPRPDRGSGRARALRGAGAGRCARRRTGSQREPAIVTPPGGIPRSPG